MSTTVERKPHEILRLAIRKLKKLRKNKERPYRLEVLHLAFIENLAAFLRDDLTKRRNDRRARDESDEETSNEAQKMEEKERKRPQTTTHIESSPKRAKINPEDTFDLDELFYDL